MTAIQIIVAVIAVTLIPICMLCCKRLAVSAIIDNEDNGASAIDVKRLEVAQKLIVKTVSIERERGDSAIEFGDTHARDNGIINAAPQTNAEDSLLLQLRKSGMRSFRGLRKALRRKGKRGSNYDSKTCPICLESYKDGEKIGGSRNPSCDHFFHLICVTDWLRYRDECALCRATFVHF